MLGDLERKLAALIADGVTTRTHLSVGIAPLDPPAPGAGSVSVGLSDLSPDTGFAPSRTTLAGTPGAPRSRRVLPVQFKAGISFILRPAEDTLTARADARALMLEDMSAVAHLLADSSLNTGAGFSTAAPDPGFLVHEFGLDSGTVQPSTEAGHYAGRLSYHGRADVWPVGVLAAEGVVLAVDPVVVALPLAMRVGDAGVRPGGATSVTVAAPQVRRLANEVTGARAALRLAVTVLADVPPDERGTVTAGVAGTETGLRVLDVTGPQLVIPYTAPAGDPGAAGRTEYLAVHLATPANGKGLFLGSAAIRLLGTG